ncbi:MAG: hypothetical protein CTY27_01875 [Methylotenera sp.]|nr:MAG: hypothetical protein CTY27_01875 [Methylotenera sp.]
MMLRLLLICSVLIGFTQQAAAISSIQITVGEVDAPVGQLKNAKFQVDLKGAQPTLLLNADLKPINEKEFAHFDLKCGQFLTEQIGQAQCLNGQFKSKQISAPFSVNFVSHPSDFALDIDFNGANFSDEAGLHAGEKLTGQIKMAAKKIISTDTWAWDGLISWTAGELYWQPFYFGKAGNQFEINGTFKQDMLNIQNASLLVNEVGKMQATATINIKTKIVEDVKVNAKNVDFAGLYAVFLKPMAEKSAFGNMDVSGKADWQFEIKNLAPTSFELNLRDANIEDKNGKFGFSHINAHIPWDYDEPKNLQLAYESGHLLKIGLHETKLTAEINRFSLTAPQLNLPVLDGALSLSDVSAVRLGDNWAWHLRMNLVPITLNEFSKALGWPEMKGQISGQIPLVTYANKHLNMDGAMSFNAFSGSISMNDLVIDDPLGVAPRLYADLKMRNLDLGDLTRTFSFGAIEGKLDGDVKDMVLENWKPVQLDASIQTSDGKHLKKISQRAVENITALGGEGTAAALQRTFLRFFKEFNYEKIGLSCKLRQDVCEMGGVESTASGYIIVKGKGIPAVNVNGYTQKVSLEDLLGRIKRITDSNTKVIVN